MDYWWKHEDPEAHIEEGKYANPAPSRVFILGYLKEKRVPLHYSKLCSAFRLDDPMQREALRRRLIAMCRDGQLIQNRKQAFCLPDKLALIAGRVQGHRDGFGFLIPDDGSNDFFLTPKQMDLLFDGDKVLVQETEVDNRQRRWCVVVEVLQRAVSQIVGMYRENNGVPLVEPESHRLKHSITIMPSGLVPTEGQYVAVDIKEYPSKRKAATGIVREIIGFRHEPGMETQLALKSHNMPHTWPSVVKNKIKHFPSGVSEKDKLSRIDLRQLPLVTIDGEDARDFDDAVYAKTKKSGGWRLYVAIADVSHYVQPDDPLDIEAQNRGNSVYLPGHVVPMLPEALSNGLCSLNPHVDRLAMICEMTISQKGRLSGYTFYEAVIRSHARLTYTQVGSMLEAPNSYHGIKYRKKFATLVPYLETLYDLYKKLHILRKSRGAIEFETVETRIVFDKLQKIKKIIPIIRNDAHKLIEECMLCANQATAHFFKKHGINSLYRIHKGPTQQKLEKLYAFLGEKGLNLLGKDSPTPKDYQLLISSIQDRHDVEAIQSMLLRSLSQAEYHPNNIGHFGLAFNAYAHFTSPIRRYPDLLAHRAIRSIIHSEQPSKNVRRTSSLTPLSKKTIYPYQHKKMLDLGDHCSFTERRADEAVRDAVTSLKCQYMQQHISKMFLGKVTSVTGFGLFVELENIYVTGLIHISSLPDDYYHFDHAKQRLVGENFRKKFCLGDTLKVRVTKVNVEDKTIDLELAKLNKQTQKNNSIKGRSRKKKNVKKHTRSKTQLPKTKKKVRNKKK